MALATTSDVKTRLGISVSTYDTLIDALRADAQAEMETYCDRLLESATVTDEYGDGLGRSFLTVKRFPVTSVTSISLRTGASTYTALNAADYAIRADGGAGIVDRVDTLTNIWSDDVYGLATFGNGPNSYKITYVGGYLSGTHDRELAALKAILCDIVAAQNPTSAATRERRAVVQSEGLGYQNITYRPVGEVFRQFHSRLDPFRRVGL